MIENLRGSELTFISCEAGSAQSNLLRTWIQVKARFSQNQKCLGTLIKKFFFMLFRASSFHNLEILSFRTVGIWCNLALRIPSPYLLNHECGSGLWVRNYKESRRLTKECWKENFIFSQIYFYDRPAFMKE